MLDSDTKRRIDTARDILVGKVPDPKSQVEQITIAMIYKFMDDMDAEAEELGGKRSFFAGTYARYGWAKLMRSGLGGHETLALYAEAITKMPENPGIPALFRDIFKNAYLPYRDPETLRAFLKIIDEFTYDHSEKLGDAFEYLLSVLGSQGDAGQFRSPRHIIDFMVAIIDPKKSETVLDPACGTVGFLISAFKHILRVNTDQKGHSTLTPSDKARLAANFKGYDISPDMVRLSLVNLYLHGFTEPHVYEYDTLTSQDRWNEYFDVILANPPFMSPKGGIKPHKRFSIQAKRSEVLFVDYIAEHLTPNGRAAIIVPEGIIFQSQGAYKDLRKMLVDNSLVAVISLPAGCFNPYSGVKTSILILDKNLARQSDSIGFFKVENDGYGLGAQRRAVEGEQLTQVKAEVGTFLQALRDRESTADLQPTCGLIVPKAEIVANALYSLSVEKYQQVEARGSAWPKVELGAVFDFLGKGQRPAAFANDQGRVPFFASSMTPSRCASADFDMEALIIGDGGSANIHYANGPFSASDHTYILRPKDTATVLPKYVYDLILSNLHLIEDGFQGQGLKNVSKKHLLSILVPLPPLNVQREIVGEINGYQKVINSARAVIDNYRPHIPIHPDWPMVALGEATKVTSGFSFSSKDFSRANPVKSIKIANVGVQEFVSDDESNLPAEFLEKYPDVVVHRGELVIALTRSIISTGLKVAIVPANYDGSLLNQRVASICAKEGHSDAKFVFSILCSEFAYRYVEEKARSLMQPNLSIVDLKQLNIPLPPVTTQRAIVEEIEAEQALVSANRELITRFEKKIQTTLARVWGEEEPKALDCGSLLPLSDPQPAAGVNEEPNEEPSDHQLRRIDAPRASRLAPEKRQQAAAVHVAQAAHEEEPSRPTHPDELDKGELMALFRDLLTRHGSSERDTVIRLAANELGYQRLSEGVSTALDNALVTAVRRWVLINEFGVLRVFFFNIADYDRKHLKSQFLAAISENGRVWMEREDAIRAFSRWFGFRRAGPKINETARSLINALMRGGQLESSGNSIRRV